MLVLVCWVGLGPRLGLATHTATCTRLATTISYQQANLTMYYNIHKLTNRPRPSSHTKLTKITVVVQLALVLVLDTKYPRESWWRA